MPEKIAGFSDLSDTQREEVFNLLGEYLDYLEEQEVSVLSDWSEAIEEDRTKISDTIGIKSYSKKLSSQEQKQVFFALAVATFYMKCANEQPEIQAELMTDPRLME